MPAPPRSSITPGPPSPSFHSNLLPSSAITAPQPPPNQHTHLLAPSIAQPPQSTSDLVSPNAINTSTVQNARHNPYRRDIDNLNPTARIAALSITDLPPVVEAAFNARTLPPTHIRQRLATIRHIPDSEFPEYSADTAETILPPVPQLTQPTANTAWGDSIHVAKPTNHTRIYFQNIYGLRITTDGVSKWQDCLRSMTEHNCDIFGFAETNCNWSRHRLRHKISSVASQRLTQFRPAMSHNSYQHDSDYLPGGTMTCTHASWGGRLQSELHDPHHMGRWSGQLYKVHSGHKLVVITAYRPCKQHANDGVYSSYKQQQLSIRARTGALHPVCPRHAFISDLIAYVTSLALTDEDFLLLMLDANEVLGEDSYGTVALLEQLRLVDLFERHHQQSCDIATHSNSKNRRIDYLLGTTNITQFISKCGYLPFQDGIDSDHRASFLELDQTFIDGRARLHVPPSRKIGYNTNKKEVLNYKEYITSEFHANDIFRRSQELFEKAAPELSDELSFLKRLNNLDTEITNIMIAGERTQCSKKPPFLWTPAVHQASLIIKYWTIQQQCDRKQKDRTDQLLAIYVQLDPDNRTAIDTAQASPTNNSTTRLQRAKVDKQRLQLKNKNARAATKRRRMHADAEYFGVEPDQALKRIGMKEESAHLFRYLDKVYTKQKGAGISHIEIPYKDAAGNLTDDPNKAAEWVKITDPAEYVPMIMERNIAHFGQARHSPFAKSPLLDVFGYTGTNASARQLIDSGIIPTSCTTNDVHAGAQAILSKLADRQNSPIQYLDITHDEFWLAFNKWDERTSTSPSNRHLGHYKVLNLSDGNDKNYKSKHTCVADNEDDLGPEKPPNPSDAIKLVYYQVAAAAVKSGNTLKRWCHSSSLMLEKIPGSPKINKLRVIHIYEADYNLMLKILWARQLVWQGHIRNAFHEGQAGSRPGHRCSDVVIRKEMNYLYARLTRTALATVDNDAKACYDRILCNLAMMVSRYFGMSSEACRFHSMTLEAMQFRIRTTTSGDSSQFYQHTPHTPIHGSGQGSCASPALWLLISTILLKVFDVTSHGMVQVDVTPGSQKTTSAEGFVDDVALFTNLHALAASDLPTLRLALRQDINTWQQTLAGSGGKLELIKCFYYILMWKFNKMGDPIPLTKAELVQQGHEDITITDPDTEEAVILSHKCVTEVHRTLGAFKTISGDEGDQYSILLAKSNQLAVSTSQGQLTRLQARRAYSSIYVPSISYSLVTTNLAPKLMSVIQSKAMLAFLPAMGFERTFPRAVVYGPRAFGGLNLCRLYTETCVAKIGAIISHVRAQTGLGKIMLININWLQMHSGLMDPIFCHTAELPYLAQNWFLHLREFLWHTQSTISIPQQWLPQLQRRKDCSLMERFSKLPSVGTDVLRIVNNWRLHFQVTTLSDIVTADGTRLQPRYWFAGRHDHSLQAESKTVCNWPIQARPDSSQFGKWIRCVKLAFRIDNQEGILPVNTQLGDWTSDQTTLTHHWPYYYDIQSNCLYQSQPSTTWWVYPQQQSLGRCNPHLWTFHQAPDDIVEILPPNAFPVSVYPKHGRLCVRHRNFRGPTTPYLKDINSFEDHILQLPKWRGDLLMHWSSLPVDQIIQLINNHDNILLASDGSYNEELGTGAFGVVIGTQDRELMTNQGSAPGTVRLLSSFRSEMYGLLAGCLLLVEITTYCKLPITEHHKLSIYIDNRGVVDRVNRHVITQVGLCEMMAPDMDIELQVLEELKILQQLGFDICPIVHVRAHQDNHKQVAELSRDAQLNVRADRLAAQVHSDQLIPIEYTPPAACLASLHVQEMPITNKYRECLRGAYDSQDLCAYMQTKYRWSDAVVNDIWWDCHDRAIRRLSHADRQTIQKFNFHHLPTLHRERFKNASLPEECYHCQTGVVETDDHVILCTSTLRMAAKMHWRMTISDYLSKEHTPLAVKQAIMLGVHNWLLSQPVATIDQHLHHLPSPVKAAYIAQTKIGWDHFVRGRCSHLWQPIIRLHLQMVPGSKITSTSWATGLVLALWNGVLAIWDVRNREHHGHDPASQQAAAKSHLLQEALPYLTHADRVHPNDRHWFDHTPVTLAEYNVVSLKAWIRNARTMVRIHHREQISALSFCEPVMIPNNETGGGF